MKECGIYRVVDRGAFSGYRGHVKGDTFVAQLEKKAERRAVERGSIERIGTVVPEPENYTFPIGWLQED